MPKKKLPSIKPIDKVVDEQVEFLDRLYDAFIGYFEKGLEYLPRLIIGIVIFAIALFTAKQVRKLTVKISSRFTRDPSLLSLFGSIGYILTLALGIFATAATIFPGLEASDLVAVLGLSSVAGGFAFKDIFENFLAGIFILIQRPFKIRDEIRVDSIQGIVEDIEFRSTIIRTYDGERVVVPNATIFKNSVTVPTENDIRRSSFQAGIAYPEDINTARAVILEAVRGCHEVLDEPGPVALCWNHDASAITFEVRYWTKSEMKYVVAAHDQVATAIKYALDKADIEIPYPHLTLDYPLDTVFQHLGHEILTNVSEIKKNSDNASAESARRAEVKRKTRSKIKAALPTLPHNAEPFSSSNEDEVDKERQREALERDGLSTDDDLDPRERYDSKTRIEVAYKEKPS